MSQYLDQRMLNKVPLVTLAFWMAYVLTRPLGASIGDWLTQAPRDGGLGFSTMPVSGVFLVIIVALVAYLTFRKVDRIEANPSAG